MLRKAGILTLALALGAGSAVGAAACGEERGTVEVQSGGTTGAGGTTGGTAPGTVPTTPKTTPETVTTGR